MLKSSWVIKEGRIASLRSDGLAPLDGEIASAQPRGRPSARRAADRDMRGQIMDVAEVLFAEHGYAMTSTRDIAAMAGVRQSMISYYFKSKRRLFEEVIKQRAMALSERRMQNLRTLLNKHGGLPPVSDLVRAFLLPLFSLLHSGPRGIAYVRLLARLHNEPEELSERMNRAVYDESIKHYLEALERALPDVDQADIHWRMMFLVGVCLYTFSEQGRLEDISGGRFKEGDIDEMSARLSNFLAHGMQAPSTRL